MRAQPAPRLEREVQHAEITARPVEEAEKEEEEEEEEEDWMGAAELRVLAAAAAERADMRRALAVQHDNRNKLIQGTLAATAMAGTLLAAMAGAMAQNSGSGTAAAAAAFVPAAVLHLGGAAVMAAVNRHRPPSALAEEQRAAARLFRKLEADARCSAPSGASLRAFRRRLAALDAAFPTIAMQGILAYRAPRCRVLGSGSEAVDQHPAAAESSSAEEANGGGWDSPMEAELRGIAGLVAGPDAAEMYVGWARNTAGVERGLALAAPALAAAAGLLSLARLGLPAGLCGAAAALLNSVSGDLQLGMVVELYRNSARHYADAAAAIETTLNSPADEREHARLFRRRVEYETGH
jgi:hypothetical protein